jgi:hypothetical protein
MILAAIKAKLRDRGPLAFALDAFTLAGACYFVAVWQLVLGGAALAAGVVVMPLVAVDLLTRQRPGARAHRCDADCASDRTECGEGWS